MMNWWTLVSNNQIADTDMIRNYSANDTMQPFTRAEN